MNKRILPFFPRRYRKKSFSNTDRRLSVVLDSIDFIGGRFVAMSVVGSQNISSFGHKGGRFLKKNDFGR
jgi:hypothetical protein